MLKECLWIPELETERLFLRKLTSTDAEDLREWLGLDIRPNVKRKQSLTDCM